MPAPTPPVTVTFPVQGESDRIFCTSLSLQSVNGLVVQKSAAHMHRAPRNRSMDSFLSMVKPRVFQCTTTTFLFGVQAMQSVTDNAPFPQAVWRPTPVHCAARRYGTNSVRSPWYSTSPTKPPSG